MNTKRFHDILTQESMRIKETLPLTSSTVVTTETTYPPHHIIRFHTSRGEFTHTYFPDDRIIVNQLNGKIFNSEILHPKGDLISCISDITHSFFFDPSIKR